MRIRTLAVSLEVKQTVHKPRPGPATSHNVRWRRKRGYKDEKLHGVPGIVSNRSAQEQLGDMALEKLSEDQSGAQSMTEDAAGSDLLPHLWRGSQSSGSRGSWWQAARIAEQLVQPRLERLGLSPSDATAPRATAKDRGRLRSAWERSRGRST